MSISDCIRLYLSASVCFFLATCASCAISVDDLQNGIGSPWNKHAGDLIIYPTEPFVCSIAAIMILHTHPDLVTAFRHALCQTPSTKLRHRAKEIFFETLTQFLPGPFEVAMAVCVAIPKRNRIQVVGLQKIIRHFLGDVDIHNLFAGHL